MEAGGTIRRSRGRETLTIRKTGSAFTPGASTILLNKHWSIDSTYQYIWLERIESKDQNVVDKKFNDNGHMTTIGLNFHF